MEEKLDIIHKLEGLMGHPGGSFVLRAGKNRDILLPQPEGQLARRDK